ncbi:hypothetical protein BU25DRAFT_456247 [Macroventuria anomochaeta]|uniref:Uncharacterized protein n=1 Tax=Macroventuria anomochaeta TaxID=301207 RepID=A0ACB6S967_9PLEO|nr:uncharacterized protein BU25DRAFT_456247 [Macroventuria anomochaeta]KAF2630523.1 hypothetical protein BU25DRAFT_456247 [Macroventuria anomochaeta]
MDDYYGLEQLNGTVVADSYEIARCNAVLIRRDRIASNFYEKLEEYKQGTADMASELFDSYGFLDLQYREDPFAKGSGVWQEEFNTADRLFLDGISVDHLHKRQVLATKLVKAITNRCRLDRWSFSRLYSQTRSPPKSIVAPLNKMHLTTRRGQSR